MNKLSKDDKYPGQAKATSFGYPPKGMWYAPEVKEADQNPQMTMYWEEAKKQFFELGNRWSYVVNQLKKMYSEITDEQIQELADKIDYYTNQYKQQKESGEMGFMDSPKGLGEGPSKGAFPSVSWMPNGAEDKDASKKTQIPSDKLYKKVKQESATSEDWSCPQCDEDCMGNCPCGCHDKKAATELLTPDQQDQVAAKYGAEMNTALMHFNDAVSHGHSKDRALEYVISEMQKVKVVIDPKKLIEAANVYLVK